jgi:3-hydroxybutyryl-CoA dehydrogenase
MNIRTVGVIGAGVMGTGVAQSLALSGYRVILLDVSNDRVQYAKKEIAKNIRFRQLFHNRANREASENIIARIDLTTDYAKLVDVDFVIENATERWDVKKPIYERLDMLCPERCIFATNTSVISITRIASVTHRADQVVGMHFMNPVPMKAMVEVVRGYHTSEETLEKVRTLLATMGKEGIVVNDMPGFVSNRVLMLAVNEAIYLVQDQVATPEEIDRIFKTCLGHKMGPLETADLIGLDTVLYSIEALYESFNDSKYRPCPLLRKKVDAGLYGMKSGQGFYTYHGSHAMG